MNDPTLIRALDYLEFEPETMGRVAAELGRERPLWLKIANFFERPLELLRQMPPQLVLWKIEHNGMEGVGPLVRRSASVTDLEYYASQLLSLDHRVVPYTFTDSAREALIELAPTLGEHDLRVLPVAQKQPLEVTATRTETRRSLGIPADAFVYGAGGFFSPEKGLEEIVAGFARTCRDSDAHLVVSVVTDDANAQAAERVRAQWLDLLGDLPLDRVHIRSGWYDEWPWMCELLRAVDVSLVNSRCESWGRMMTEPIGLGTPVVVRRARCSTNTIVPEVSLVEDFTDFDSPVFTAAVQAARLRSKALRSYVEREYGIPAVRGRFLDVLRAETPPELGAELDVLAEKPAALTSLDNAITY